MFFSVGVETPDNKNTAYGMVIPAFEAYGYSCFSAADDQKDIPSMVREAILLTVEDMVNSGKFLVEQIQDAGHLAYSMNPEYSDFDSWFVIDIDLSDFEGKQQRINIALPDTLIKRIDNQVKQCPSKYRDRSHFIAQATRHELTSS